MNKASVHAQAVTEGEPYHVLVFVERGAVLPPALEGGVVVELGATLARPAVAEVGVDGLSVTLSFNMAPFACFFPWDSIGVIGNSRWAVRWALEALVEPNDAPANKPGLRLV